MMFDDKALDGLAELLALAAAQEIMPRFRRLGAGDIRSKSSATDLVTEADVNAERLITAALRERYPGALVIGEEACAENPALLGGLAGADLAFVIDPVDGTFNFACGAPLFGVMLAVVVKGETAAGLIYDPIGKDWLATSRGAGSYLRTSDGGSVRCQVASPVPIGGTTGAVSWQYADEPLRTNLARNQAKCHSQIGYRCAAHEYRMLALGHMHFVVYNKLMPWDHLAGALIHAEAGGYSARFNGSRYEPRHVDGGLLLAPDRASWEELRRELWADS